MRFKAIIEHPEPIIRMLTSLSHMAKDCLIVLCRQNWKFMINEKFVNASHPQCYASTPIGYVFSHYIVESQANNEILLQLNIRNLLAAFKTVKENVANMTILKLTKKHSMALLSFEMWQDDGNELRVNVIQDVSVKPVQHSKFYLYEEPQLGAYHASSNLPPVKSLKTVIERMRTIKNSQHRESAMLYINNNDGRLLLEIKTEHCSLKTIYQNLSVNNRELHHDQNSEERRTNVSAKIDLKYLAKVIGALGPLSIKQTVIAITKKTCVTIHARLSDNMPVEDDQNVDSQTSEDAMSARVTFYLCVYIDDDDEEEEDEEESDDAEDEDEDEDDENHNNQNEQDMQDID